MNKEDKILAYLLGEMNEEERSAFETEMVNSDQASREFAEYSELLSSINNFEYDKNSNRLSGKFEKMLETEISKVDNKIEEKTKTISLSSWKVWAVAASILAAGIFIGLQFNNDTPVAFKKEKEFATLVKSERTSQRISGVNMLQNANELDAHVLETLNDILHNDPSSNVQLAVVESLTEHFDQQEVKTMLLEAVRTIDKPIVRISIIDILTRSGQKSIIPEFEKILNESDLDKMVKDELYISLRKLSSNI
ncbi:MAG: HEAT repeat domain-containing protein [Bacteroidota bacterium]